MTEIRRNKMGYMPVKNLIITMALPMMISMLVQALYNVVDSIFVARIEERALTAVSLAFPLQNLMIGLGSGMGVGINALLSRSLGEKNYDKADEAACTGLMITALHFIVFLLISIFVAGPFINGQTDDPVIRSYGTTYLKIVCGCSFGLFFQMTSERLLQSTGRTVHSMILQATGAITNIILDPIMIFGLFGCPKMGIAGAAAATVIGQCLAATLGIFFNLKFNKDIRITMGKILRPTADTLRQLYSVGIPSVLMMAVGSVMSYLLNRILISFSATATAVFGVYFKLQSFFFMPVFGLNSGLVPVLAFNYGARRKDRIMEALRFSLMLAGGIMCTGLVIFELIPRELLALFNASPEMERIGVAALRIIAVNFPVASVCIILGSTFQAFSRSIYSLIVSLCRQLLVLIPAAWLLAQLGEVTYIWFAFPIAETVSLVISLLLYRKIKREIIDKCVPQGEPL